MQFNEGRLAFQQMGQEQVISIGKKININLNLTHYTKVNFKWITGLKGKHKIFRKIEAFLNLTPKAQSIKGKID